ncbi:O-acetylhomoserine sulfhydrolase [Syntrophobotulus glycolicus DSM 8271]|uniref:homocysteine desulfhydrase n=1 Tax=Syntrophobotulus glycolicus (strain DSM 8271 / FlGlyR) TaxID=645991 RepID=F0SWH0_SYNGF|nr:aminotransferase class I/II-fold pyridoxal phosphate-dependent enzyme [Syntrophobotulus glycolicus]ADY55736.1 O-acetylhomoserine sulfhydrolase [Syntrophobotulus glycolicus DSM 8271]
MSYGFDTLKVQAGYRPEQHNYAVSVPIYQTAAFALGDSYRADRLFSFMESDPIYTRLSNPTADVLEQRLCALHGAGGGIALASGMAAVSYTLLNAAGKGGRILTTARLYGGTVDCFGHLFPDLGVEIDLVENPDDPGEFQRKLTAETRAIFVESLTNPFAAIPNLQALADIAHEHGILLIVDNTLATPYLCNPFEHGADVVVYSATKGLSGHGNVIAGVVLESGKFDYGNGHYPHFAQPLWFLRDGDDQEQSILRVFPDIPFTGRLRAIHLNYLGAALSPFDAYLVLLGLETLSERVQKQVANTRAVLAYLENNRHVAWVRYPYAQGSPYRELADRYFPKGAGAVLSFGFKGTEEQKRQFLAATKIFGYQANIGDARSLIINPAQTTHVELTPAQRELVGLSLDTIRLSLGLENASDLIGDLEQAFQTVFGG